MSRIKNLLCELGWHNYIYDSWGHKQCKDCSLVIPRKLRQSIPSGINIKLPLVDGDQHYYKDDSGEYVLSINQLNKQDDTK